MATYNFLVNGMIAEDRNKRNTRVKSLTWDELSDYFTDAIESDDRLIIETEARKGTDFPLEARMLVKNAICPLGETFKVKGVSTENGELSFVHGVDTVLTHRTEQVLLSDFMPFSYFFFFFFFFLFSIPFDGVLYY